MSLLAQSLSKLQRGMKVKTVFQVVRLLLKLGSCILYVAQTVSDENSIDTDFIYPRWCCHGNAISLLTYFSQPQTEDQGRYREYCRYQKGLSISFQCSTILMC